MKVLHLNIHEQNGGASRAAHRLYQGQRAAGLDAQMVVLRKTSRDPNVITLPMSRLQQTIRRRTVRFERPSLSRYPNYQGTPWSVGWLSAPVAKFALREQPEIVHLHWVGDGYLSVESIAQLPGPIVWTMHDMWPLTGGCHYTGGCDRFHQMCGACPQLGSSTLRDLSRWTMTQKRRYWFGLDLTLVAPSHWLAESARASLLMGAFRIEVIPNGIDLKVYRPFDQGFAREVLNLADSSKKLILFGAYRVDDERKGFHHLQAALASLSELDRSDVALVVFGESHPLPPMGVPVHYVGTLQDDRLLALLYSAVDVFVAPSLQDNLPNTVMEAMACGVPCVAFDVGGMPDMITHQSNGYLARAFDPLDLGRGINWVIEDAERWAGLSAQARQDTIDRFDVRQIAQRYADLYADVRQSQGKIDRRS
ncbi:MAG: glycosyltransferase family 4 protein [Anaerolineae bacterium]|jgi:glycosyltransferase involved in cell wall biosynthesis|nr:glycosyltransferase family 4 protein [Anaerolineae bacterium]